MEILVGIVISLSLFWTGCAGKTEDDKKRALYHLQIGSGHLAKGNYPGALGEFLKAEELDKENPLVHNQLGLAYYLRQKFTEAEKQFQMAIRFKPLFTEARNNLGRTLIELKKYREAIAELQIAAKDLLYSEPEKVHANIGLAYFQMNDFAKAEKAFFESLKLRRKNCMAMAYYGRCLYEQSVFEKAAESLDQAIEACKTMKLEDPYYYSAMSYMKAGQREQAVARLEEGLVAFPEGQFAAKSRSMLELLK